jgi:membrane protein DedA with SNARE-associated domain
VLAVLDSFFKSLEDMSDSYWFFIVVFVIAMLDSVLPVVPSETMVIFGGVSAGLGSFSYLGKFAIIPVIGLAALGAFTGDNISYAIGDYFSERLTTRYNRTDKGKKRLAWAHQQVHERGGELLVTARFIPGGRTIVTLTCGITEQDKGWFYLWDGIATTLWACYAAGLGFFFGNKFSDNHSLAFFIAFGTALSATGVIEIIRAINKRRTSGRSVNSGVQP